MRARLTIFRRRHHPFAFTVKCKAGDISGMAFEGEDCGGIGRLDVVQLDGVVAGSCQESLVGADT